MEILGKILGNLARVKIMRLFLLNRSKGFRSRDIIKRSRVSSDAVRKELKLLASVEFIKKRSSVSTEWYFNSSFKYADEFEDLLVRSESLTYEYANNTNIRIITNSYPFASFELLVDWYINL